MFKAFLYGYLSELIIVPTFFKYFEGRFSNNLHIGLKTIAPLISSGIKKKWLEARSDGYGKISKPYRLDS